MQVYQNPENLNLKKKKKETDGDEIVAQKHLCARECKAWEAEKRMLTETMHDTDGIRLNSNLGLPRFSSPFQVCL